MRWWKPAPGQPQRLDWWRPLLAVSRRAQLEQVRAPVKVRDFTLGGRVDRGPRPAVWVYVHRRTSQEVLADSNGRTYDFVRYRSGRALGRFKEIDVQHAVWRARLPAVDDPDDDGEPDPPNAYDVRRPRHLRLVSPPC
jgi:hypothetical protein